MTVCSLEFGAKYHYYITLEWLVRDGCFWLYKYQRHLLPFITLEELPPFTQATPGMPNVFFSLQLVRT